MFSPLTSHATLAQAVAKVRLWASSEALSTEQEVVARPFSSSSEYEAFLVPGACADAAAATLWGWEYLCGNWKICCNACSCEIEWWSCN